mgnify:CR=1 FL=1
MKLSKAYSQYGADLGRANRPSPYSSSVDVPTLRASVVRLHLARVYLDTGGYDTGGAYWGVGTPLYRAWDEDEIELFLRAPDRDAAKAMIRTTYPRATFYR